ncbi:molybdopterin-dependent oxidoreductase [Curvibacter sp. HBC61]|uniref:Molybdopterin-dependent oxidoreductase n=1 Tax=Curvibacter cyanobacteriorum TaxID=3026422 RepID=A0ABT5N3C2_9BURK|nr:nitrate reductase [Curvibacter sp. HBC61]MDD0840810.1 molybdopterin-dependent oxidoreductase [Curvibacter sp. HBC61]
MNLNDAPRETRSTCPYCGVGCGVIIESRGDAITGVRGDPAHPANLGRLCTKGSTLHLTASPQVNQQTRLLQPLRRLQRGGPAQALAWDQALDLAGQKLADTVQQHGPNALGFYLSGQLLTEDYYVFNKLVKGLLGSNNLDTNSRLCMSSAVAGYKATLGADAPPASYTDVDHAHCLFITGSNTAWAHPILFRRIEDAKRARPEMKIVVVDPRRTDTVELADLHLALQPGTDVMLYHGMLHLMLREGWTQPAYIAAHTTGFEALVELVRDCTPERTAEVCGLRVEDLCEATRLFATSPATLSLYCQGLNQSSSGTSKNAALINLHLATGQIGRPGAAPFSLTGQPNAMGGREVGGLSNLLSAHRDMGNPAHRAEVAALWGVADVPAVPGKSAIEMFQAAADGEIKALWIACTNPAQSLPDQATVRRALERAEFVVVQEAFATTATTAYADLLLPATPWGEKTGTVTNSERRISRVRAALPPRGEARHDWAIGVALAQRLEARLRPGQPTLFPYDTQDALLGTEAIWLEHRESTRGRDLDITGLSYALLDTLGPQQWPWPEGARAGRVRLYEDGVFPTPDGRARFHSAAFRPVAEATDREHPYALNTGRLRDQWHGMSRTGTLGRLFGHAAEPALQMNPQDLAREGWAEGSLVRVQSRRGSVVLPVQACAEQAPQQVFIPMHWGQEFVSGRDADGQPHLGVNALMPSTFCPQSKQPELKHAAVRLSAAKLPWTLVAMAWLPAGQVLSTREALKALMGEFAFSSCVPFSDRTPLEQADQQATGLLFRAAAHQAPPAAQLLALEQALGLDPQQCLHYADPQRGQRRTIRVQTLGGARCVTGWLLAGDTRAQAWLRPLLQDAQPVSVDGQRLLSPGAEPPLAQAPRSPLVCSCFGVTEQAIRGQLAQCAGTEDERLKQLQGALKCGTNCGSCVPELKRLVRWVRPSTEAAELAL